MLEPKERKRKFKEEKNKDEQLDELTEIPEEEITGNGLNYREYLEFFGERIRKLRTTLGLSQLEFAKASGLTQKQISYYERSKKIPSLFSLKKIVDTFHVNPSMFFSDEE